jgi:hypothetical protein
MAHHGAVSGLVAKSVCGSSVRDQIHELNSANQRNTFSQTVSPAAKSESSVFANAVRVRAVETVPVKVKKSFGRKRL